MISRNENTVVIDGFASPGCPTGRREHCSALHEQVHEHPIEYGS